jgi:hypothetical protein
MLLVGSVPAPQEIMLNEKRKERGRRGSGLSQTFFVHLLRSSTTTRAPSTISRRWMRLPMQSAAKPLKR